MTPNYYLYDSLVTIARRLLIDEGVARSYHVMSRCVRKSFLCGNQYAYRKKWLHSLLKLCARSFCVDVLAFALMDNHFHLVLKNQPQQTASLSNEEVWVRWHALYHRRGEEDNTLLKAMQVSDEEWIAVRRKRLSSISWFLKIMKERIARWANKEDDCRGAFWEGRFKSIRLLDKTALIACMAYVDLNPIRAGSATEPKNAHYTSAYDRLLQADKTRHPWLASLESTCCTIDLYYGNDSPITPKEYFQLLADNCVQEERTLQRLLPQIEDSRWHSFTDHSKPDCGLAIGSSASRAREALRRGIAWVADKARLHNK